jgi:UrcA family protein
MNTKAVYRERRSASLWLPAMAAVASLLAIASQTFAADQIPEITVEGGQMTKAVIKRSSGRAAPMEVVTLTRHVNYADLDVSTHSGATELKKRIDATAKATCRELHSLFPFQTGSDSERSCVNKARKPALVQAQETIDNAEKARTAAR